MGRRLGLPRADDKGAIGGARLAPTLRIAHNARTGAFERRRDLFRPFDVLAVAAVGASQGDEVGLRGEVAGDEAPAALLLARRAAAP